MTREDLPQTMDASRSLNPSTGTQAADLGGGAARPASALNVPKRGLRGPHGVSSNIDSIADAMKPPQPIGLAKICFVGPELTDAQYWRMKRAIESYKADA